MGMYTDLRGAVVLKNEYVEAINSYMDDSISDEDYDLLLKKYPLLEQFDEIDRGGSGMFSQDLDFYPLSEKQELFNPRVEENIWYFKSHIKNYLDDKYFVRPYEFLIETLIPLISKEILILESYYEEYDDYFDQWYLDLEGLKIKIVSTYSPKASFLNCFGKRNNGFKKRK